MPGRRNVLDALSEGAAAPHDVENLGLVPFDLDCARSHKVCRRVQVHELVFIVFLLKN